MSTDTLLRDSGCLLRPVLAVLLALLAFPLVAASQTAVIVLPVNEERIIIGSIEGVSPHEVELFDGSTFLGFSNRTTYNSPIPLSPGAHVVRVTFNGMEISQAVELAPGETRTLTFVFRRTEFNLADWIDQQHIFLDQRYAIGFELSQGEANWSLPCLDPWGFRFRGVALLTGLDTVHLSSSQRASYSLKSKSFSLFNEAHLVATSLGHPLGAVEVGPEETLYETNSRPISISSQPFSNWFVQYKRSELYPLINLFSEGSNTLLLWGTPGTDTVQRVWASLSYDHASVRNLAGGDAVIHASFTSGCCPGGLSQSAAANEHLDYLKMSSVPYNVANSGVCSNGLTCDDGKFCNGQESCDEVLGCRHGKPPCDDGNPCSADACDEKHRDCSNVQMPNCPSQYYLPFNPDSLPVPINGPGPWGGELPTPIINAPGTSGGTLNVTPLELRTFGLLQTTASPLSGTTKLLGSATADFEFPSEPAFLWYLTFDGLFDAPITIEFPYDPNSLLPSVDPADLVIYEWVDGGWLPLPSVVNSGDNSIVATASTLSLFALGLQRASLDFFTLPPCRLLDTRNGPGMGGPALAAGSLRSFQAVGNCGVPSTATAVTANVTVVEPSGSGYLSIFRGGESNPNTSSITFTGGQVRANNAVIALGSAGDYSVFCGMSASGTTQLVVDVVGYFQKHQP